MVYSLLTVPSCRDSIEKRTRKNRALQDALDAKIVQILANPRAFKPLEKPMQGMYRVHILKSFVLIYEILENENAVRLLRFAHHDDAY